MIKWEIRLPPGRLFYSLEEISDALGLSPPSARVFCSRKVRAGELIRARRDLYLLPESFRQFEEKDFFALANRIQTPSYVSFTSALSFYGLTTQITSSVVESANPVRSCTYQVQGISFRYFYCRPAFFFGYEKQGSFFVAEPEKALLDSLYLLSLGRYALDFNAIGLKGIRWRKIEKWLKKYPRKVRRFYANWRSRYEDARAA